MQPEVLLHLLATKLYVKRLPTVVYLTLRLVRPCDCWPPTMPLICLQMSLFVEYAKTNGVSNKPPCQYAFMRERVAFGLEAVKQRKETAESIVAVRVAARTEPRWRSRRYQSELISGPQRTVAPIDVRRCLNSYRHFSVPGVHLISGAVGKVGALDHVVLAGAP